MSRSSARVAKRKRDEEETYYRAKIRADPKDASAHYDLARVLMARERRRLCAVGYNNNSQNRQDRAMLSFVGSRCSDFWRGRPALARHRTPTATRLQPPVPTDDHLTRRIFQFHCDLALSPHSVRLCSAQRHRD